MRLLIGICCRVITVFEAHCKAYGANLAFADVDRHCVLSSHVFKILEPYLDNAGGVEELTDFRDYYDMNPEDYPLVEECDEDDNFPDPEFEARREWLEYTPFPDEPLDDCDTCS